MKMSALKSFSFVFAKETLCFHFILQVYVWIKAAAIACKKHTVLYLSPKLQFHQPHQAKVSWGDLGEASLQYTSVTPVPLGKFCCYA